MSTITSTDHLARLDAQLQTMDGQSAWLDRVLQDVGEAPALNNFDAALMLRNRLMASGRSGLRARLA